MLTRFLFFVVKLSETRRGRHAKKTIDRPCTRFVSPERNTRGTQPVGQSIDGASCIRFILRDDFGFRDPNQIQLRQRRREFLEVRPTQLPALLSPSRHLPDGTRGGRLGGIRR